MPVERAQAAEQECDGRVSTTGSANARNLGQSTNDSGANDSGTKDSGTEDSGTGSLSTGSLSHANTSRGGPGGGDIGGAEKCVETTEAEFENHEVESLGFGEGVVPHRGTLASDSLEAALPGRKLSRLKRSVYLAGATLFFILALLGIMLPVLPTTPFLLLTSYFLVRSSPRLNAALLRSRTFGPILVDWQVHGGVRRDIKIKAIVVVVLAIALTIYISGYSILVTGLVSVLASIGIFVIIRLPIAREPESDTRA